MSDRQTPETDAALYPTNGVDIVWPEFARKLERERDEARELHRNALREREATEKEVDATLERAHKAERERDEAIAGRQAYKQLAVKHAQERDEARSKLEDLDVAAIHTCHDQCQRPMCVLRRERDESRELARQMSESNQVLMADVRFYRNAWEEAK